MKNEQNEDVPPKADVQQEEEDRINQYEAYLASYNAWLYGQDYRPYPYYPPYNYPPPPRPWIVPPLYPGPPAMIHPSRQTDPPPSPRQTNQAQSPRHTPSRYPIRQVMSPIPGMPWGGPLVYPVTPRHSFPPKQPDTTSLQSPKKTEATHTRIPQNQEPGPSNTSERPVTEQDETKQPKSGVESQNQESELVQVDDGPREKKSEDDSTPQNDLMHDEDSIHLEEEEEIHDPSEQRLDNTTNPQVPDDVKNEGLDPDKEKEVENRVEPKDVEKDILVEEEGEQAMNEGKDKVEEEEKEKQEDEEENLPDPLKQRTLEIEELQSKELYLLEKEITEKLKKKIKTLKTENEELKREKEKLNEKKKFLKKENGRLKEENTLLQQGSEQQIYIPTENDNSAQSGQASYPIQNLAQEFDQVNGESTDAGKVLAVSTEAFSSFELKELDNLLGTTLPEFEQSILCKTQDNQYYVILKQ